jgi:hypothetical protein
MTGLAIANNRAVFGSNSGGLYYSIYNTSTFTWSNLSKFNTSFYAWSIALTQDGNRGVIGQNGGYINYFTWNASSMVYNSPIQILDTNIRNYWSVALSPSGNVLVTGAQNNIYIANWNGSNYSTLTSLITFNNGTVVYVGISPDGNRLVYNNKPSGPNSNGVFSMALWNGTTFDVTNAVVFDSSSQSLGLWETHMAFSPDSSVLFMYRYYYTWNETTQKYVNRQVIPTTAYKSNGDVKGVAVHDRGNLGMTLHYISSTLSTNASDTYSSTNVS